MRRRARRAELSLGGPPPFCAVQLTSTSAGTLKLEYQRISLPSTIFVYEFDTQGWVVGRRGPLLAMLTFTGRLARTLAKLGVPAAESSAVAREFRRNCRAMSRGRVLPIPRVAAVFLRVVLLISRLRSAWGRVSRQRWRNGTDVVEPSRVACVAGAWVELGFSDSRTSVTGFDREGWASAAVPVSPLHFGQPIATLARAITAVAEVPLEEAMELATETLARRTDQRAAAESTQPAPDADASPDVPESLR